MKLAERTFIFFGNLVRLAQGIRINPLTYYKVHRSSHVELPKSVRIVGRYFSIGQNSSVTFQDDCLIQGFFYVGDNCKVEIGKHFRMTNHPSFVASDNSVVRIADYCLIDQTQYAPTAISVIAGKLTLDRNVSVRGSIKIRKGEILIGSDSFLNHGSEIRSEVSVSIGTHVLISYFVDIFDTNTHSTYWHDRHAEIDDGFPNSTVQTDGNRPATSPIVIEDDVWIGKHCAILKGVTIGARSIIGIRSVVTKSCPQGSLVVGNPASNRLLNSNFTMDTPP